MKLYHHRRGFFQIIDPLNSKKFRETMFQTRTRGSMSAELHELSHSRYGL